MRQIYNLLAITVLLILPPSVYGDIGAECGTGLTSNTTILAVKVFQEQTRSIIKVFSLILQENRTIEYVVADPSAASFIECIRRHGEFDVIPAKNDVLLVYAE